MLPVSCWASRAHLKNRLKKSLTGNSFFFPDLLDTFDHLTWSTEALSSNLSRHICTTFPSEPWTVSLMRRSQLYISLRSSACLPGLSGCRMGDGWRAGVLPEACPCSLQRPPSQSRITHHKDNADRMFLMNLRISRNVLSSTIACFLWWSTLRKTSYNLRLVRIVMEQYNIGVLKDSLAPVTVKKFSGNRPTQVLSLDLSIADPCEYFRNDSYSSENIHHLQVIQMFALADCL